METILSSISDGVLVANAEGEFTFFNPSAEQIAGGVGMLDLKSGQWAGDHGVFHPDKKTRMPTAQFPLVRAVRGEATDDVEMFVRHGKKPDGYHVSVSGRPLQTDIDGHGGGVIVFRDITRQKKAAAEWEKTMGQLRNQSELMETTFKSISDGIVVADAAGKFLYVNPAAEHIVGMGITDGPQEEWAETYGTYYPDRETPMKTENLPLIRAIFGGESTDEEEGRALAFAQGRREAEKGRRLTNSHRRLEAVLNATGDAIAMHDSAGRLVFANRVYEDLLGLKESELKEIPPRDLTARLEERFREPDLGGVEGRFHLDSGHVVETAGPGQEPQQRLFLPLHRAGARWRRGGNRPPGFVPGRVQGDRGRADEGRGAAPAQRAGVHQLICRHGRRQPRNGEGVHADAAGRRGEHLGPRSRRERHRQGAGGQVRSPRQRA